MHLGGIHFASFFEKCNSNILLKFYLFLSVLGVHCCTGIFSLVEFRGWCWWTSHCNDFSCCRVLALGTGVSAVVAHGLSSCGSPALEHWLSNCGGQLSCSMACGILSDQGSNSCHLHWQAESMLLSHQGSPSFCILYLKDILNSIEINVSHNLCW